ncbi:SDR family NAD(P)-dependent oxidoreductase [candidate division WWE3 bacterium]|uniref:SDR family NAD(P)-dependent oxidoreductase n=1 Tax=candidate division WWE3 bacterium TaxID=2053526 RepID=A0A955EDT5_UNCKA|nr:SDR family NAD(P)-dependent oxidoreductase [candidate division WWE3 bacterium]
MKKVLITGANRGIGLATAKKFLNEGYFVYATCRTGQIPELEGENLQILQLDTTSGAFINDVATVVETAGGIDILINNAGVLLDLESNVINMQKLRDTMEVNFFGTVAVTEALIPYINNVGSIVNLSSSMGAFSEDISANSYAPSYDISKAALNMYTRSLAGRYVGSDLHVSSICPGWVKTDMGGPNGERAPEDAANDIFKLATSTTIPTGQFWLLGETRSW